jgi:hypothetical protein
VWESGHARVEPRVVPTWFRLFRLFRLARLTSIWKSRVDLSRFRAPIQCPQRTNVRSERIVSMRTLTHAKRAFVSAHVEILILVLLYENG